MTRLASGIAAMFGTLAACVMAYAAIAAFRDMADIPAAMFAVLAVMWAIDAQESIAEARRGGKS